MAHSSGHSDVNAAEMAALKQKGIHVGDTVRTAYRGGVREGCVTEIATTTSQHPHPPKVIFERTRPGQEAKEVAHNPSTLEKVTAASVYEGGHSTETEKAGGEHSGHGDSRSK